MRRILQSFFSIAGILAGTIVISPALAQTGADFYKGKTVTYIASTAPGGGYDLYGRLVAEYMQKHLPGSTFVVKNIPGAGHLIGANAIYASKPDGLTIGIFNTGLIYTQLIKHEAVRFDLAKMSWIGKAAAEPRVIVIAAHSSIKTFADLRAHKETVNFATGGFGSAGYVEATMLINVLKLPVKLLTGYNGGEDQMAMRRGEITGGIGSPSTFDQFVKNGYGHFIVQIGGDTQSAPQLSSQVTDPAGKALIALIQSQGDISRLTAGPPGIPQDRIDALRDAYRKAMEDPELRAKARKLEIPIEPAYGDAVADMVKKALNQRPETIALLKDTLEKKEAPSGAALNKGTVAEWDGRAKLVLKLEDGKMFPAEISGSRTEITIAGQKGDRGSLKVGMTCTIDGASGGEAKAVSCTN